MDAVYVLHSTISHVMESSNVPCAFIDFSKAFDKVDRNILYAHLMEYGISSKMLQIIVDMYSKLKSQVRTNNGYKETFSLDIGVLQGECSSPTLFSFHLNSIVNYMNNVTNMGVTLRNGKISVLKYADDVVLIATDAEVLQKALRALEQFCADNRLTVNTEKSKLMCFAKRRPTMLSTLYYEENQLEWVMH